MHFLRIDPPPYVLSEQPQNSDQNIPTELQVSDPEVKSYVDSAESSGREGKTAAVIEQLQQALELCGKKGLTKDKAVVESKLAGAYILTVNDKKLDNVVVITDK